MRKPETSSIARPYPSSSPTHGRLALRIVASAMLLLLILPAAEALAFSPKKGWKKVVVRRAAPNKQKPPRIIDGTTAQIVQEYSETVTLYARDEELGELARRAVEEKLEMIVRDDFDVLQLPNGYIDTRKGSEASLPGRRLGPPAQAGVSGL